MAQIFRYAIGIDCSKDALHACFSSLDEAFQVDVKATKKFENNPSGINALINWAHKHNKEQLPLRFLVEATGIYHEELATMLFDEDYQVFVVLPEKAHHYAKAQDFHASDDYKDARKLALMALKENFQPWQKPDPVYRKLRNIMRERHQLLKERTALINKKHSQGHSHYTTERLIDRASRRIEFIDDLLKENKADYRHEIQNNPKLQNEVDIITSIPGFGEQTALIILAETGGFNLIKNRRQLVGFAGMDIVNKTSGISIKTKPKISKKGNAYLRGAMYFPSWTAIRHDQKMNNLYSRLFKKHHIKIKAGMAVQRKLLELSYLLWKKGEYYKPNSEEKQAEEEKPNFKGQPLKEDCPSGADQEAALVNLALNTNLKNIWRLT